MPQNLPVPENLHILSRSDAALLLSWDSPPNAAGHQMEISWPGQSPTLFEVTNPQPVENLLFLASNRHYSIRVRSFVNDILSDFSNVLLAITKPPKPEPIMGANFMLDNIIRLEWHNELPATVDTLHPLFAEISMDDSNRIIATDLPLSGSIIDRPPLGRHIYSIRMFSHIDDIGSALKNVSDWSNELSIAKQVFAMMHFPGSIENQRIRERVIRNS